ncbi:50S ribosomal protein L23 [Candidatus Woesearchaeota archaeon]|nr:50S ribosomal protein L23 [Candidatus Woesearchaeota archaeon]
MNANEVVKYPLATEKAMRLMEAENKLVFVVASDAAKPDIKKAVEELFKAKVVSVNTLHSVAGHKRAIVKFAKESPAIDIATTLGLM